MDEQKVKDYGLRLGQILSKYFNHPSEKETGNVAKGQMKILVSLAEHPEGLHSGELCPQLNVGTGRIANALKELEKKGLVKRVSDEKDRRMTLVFLTEEGHKAVEDGTRCFLLRLEKTIEGIGEKEFNHLLLTLERINDLNARLDQEEKNKKEAI
ncbi:MAG: winged helix DNA-binding protein [Bacilli bacterium]|jgi:DNA-binding MarR family transcriptional regulator|nr:winged helix DNA-binding protein [Bacilli bacterium]